MSPQDDRKLAEKIVQQLDKHAEQLDEITAARLKAARLQALATSPSRRPVWTGLGMATAAGLLAVVFFWQYPTEAPIVIDELDILASGEDLEMLEDLEFYDWLAKNRVAG